MEEYRNPVEYYRNENPMKGMQKWTAGRAEDQLEQGSGNDGEQQMKQMFKGGQRLPRVPNEGGMEGESRQRPNPPMFLELQPGTVEMSGWQPPTPPQLGIPTYPKAPPISENKKQGGAMEPPKERVLKRRTIWVAEKEENPTVEEGESSDSQEGRKMKAHKGHKYSKWIAIDDDTKVKSYYRLPSKG